jgi:hypothetical protein
MEVVLYEGSFVYGSFVGEIFTDVLALHNLLLLKFSYELT